VNLALVLILISLGFIALYAIDYGISWVNPEGLIPIDPFSKGVVIGVPSLVLPLISFAMQKNNPSAKLSQLLLTNGGLVILGGLVMAVTTAGESFDAIRYRVISELVLILAIGIIQIILGFKSGRALKVKATR